MPEYGIFMARFWPNHATESSWATRSGPTKGPGRRAVPKNWAS